MVCKTLKKKPMYNPNHPSKKFQMEIIVTYMAIYMNKYSVITNHEQFIKSTKKPTSNNALSCFDDYKFTSLDLMKIIHIFFTNSIHINNFLLSSAPNDWKALLYTYGKTSVNVSGVSSA